LTVNVSDSGGWQKRVDAAKVAVPRMEIHPGMRSICFRHFSEWIFFFSLQSGDDREWILTCGFPTGELGVGRQKTAAGLCAIIEL
jgi:hypothetical protein